MMRSPYQSPTEAPKQRFLRRRPIEPHGKGRWVLAGIGAVAAYLVYTFVFSDSGLLKIAALKRETEVLKQRRVTLAVEMNDLESRRKAQARDPLLEERVARERFRLVKKDEIIYRYQDASADSGR
jgi:cell division protein FtsB